MSLMRKLMLFGTAVALLSACSEDRGVEITAPLTGSAEQPTIAEAHAALKSAAYNTCPSGYDFDDSSITYGAEQQDRPTTVTIKVWCK